ncbi:carbohydrate ABC transporter permease [Treponema phagedenis]
MHSYLNTIIYTAGHTVLVILLTAMTAYPLSIKTLPFKNGFTIFLTFTMFFSGGTIPTYLLMRHLHLINNRLVMIIPFAVSTYNVILFRTFFLGINSELRESAKIDGAGEMRILFQIILPLSKAIIATVGLFTMVGKWNDWFSALIYLTDEKKYPVQMILRKILFNSTALNMNDARMMEIFRLNAINPLTIQMATIVVISFPIMCIYPFLQKHFTKGVLLGGIKG